MLHKRKEWLFVLFFMCSLWAQPHQEILEKVIRNPESFFDNNLEKAVFLKFRKNFSHFKVTQINNNAITYQDNQNNLSYTLNFEFKNNKIYRVYRDIDLKNNSDLNTIETLNLKKWLGSFLYRIDSGMLSAAEDMVYQSDIYLKYTDTSEKSGIIAALKKNFNDYIKFQRVEIIRENDIFDITMQLDKFPALIIKLPFRYTVFFKSDQDVLIQNLFLLTKDEIAHEPHKINKKEICDFNDVSDIKKFYNDFSLNNNTLFIRYPQQKVKNFDGIQYMISSQNADPRLNLSYNSGLNTVTLNEALTFIYYSAPDARDNNLERIKMTLSRVYKMLLPHYPDKYINSQHIKGYIKFSGLKQNEINFNDEHTWHRFLCTLRKEGALFFYPTKINNLQNEIMIDGILYVMPLNDLPYYHFSDLTIIFDNTKEATIKDCRAIVYAFIKKN